MSRDPLALSVEVTELDTGTSSEVIDGLCERAEQAQRFDVAVDISRVTFMDSTAVGGFIRLQRFVESHDGSLELIHATPGIRRLFGLLGLEEFVRLAPEQ